MAASAPAPMPACSSLRLLQTCLVCPRPFLCLDCTSQLDQQLASTTHPFQSSAWNLWVLPVLWSSASALRISVLWPLHSRPLWLVTPFSSWAPGLLTLGFGSQTPVIMIRLWSPSHVPLTSESHPSLPPPRSGSAHDTKHHFQVTWEIRSLGAYGPKHAYRNLVGFSKTPRHLITSLGTQKRAFNNN